jgi:TP901 family phage tail tape measure protein
MAEVQQRLVFIVAARDDNTRRVMEAVQRALEETGNSGVRVSKQLRESFSGLGKSISGAARGINDSLFNVRNAIVGTGIAAGFTTAASSALEFGKGMAQISAIVNDAAKDMPIVEERVRGIAVAFGATHADTIKAQYDIISSGFGDAADAAQILEVSAKLARAGVADLGETADLMTSIINGFGLSVSDAEHAADVLFKTVQIGKVTIPELARQMGDVAAPARLAGVSLEEVGAMISQLTISGIRAPEAVTGIRSMLIGLMAPSVEAEKALERVGIAVTKVGADGKKQMIPMIEVIEKFRGLDLEILRKLIPDIEALKAMGTLTENFSAFEKTYTQFVDKEATAGTLEEAFARSASNAGFSIDQLRSAIKDLSIEMGQGFTDELAMSAKDVLKNFDDLKVRAREFGEETGRAIKATVAFVKEWKDEIKALIVAYIALRAAAIAVAVASSTATIVQGIRRAHAAVVLWTTGMRGLLLATTAAQAGIAGVIVVVGSLIAAPLGKWLGDAIGGVSDLADEFDRFSANSKAAAGEFEASFVKAIGTGSAEARRLHNEGLAVLVQDTILFNRATGEAIETAEDLERANQSLGTTTHVTAGTLIDVTQAARDAAAAFAASGEKAAAYDFTSQDIAKKTQVSADIIAKLPQAIRDEFKAADMAAADASARLKQYQADAKKLIDDIDEARARGDDRLVSVLERSLSEVEDRIPKVQHDLNASSKQVEGLIAAINQGATEQAKLDEERRRQLEDEERARKIRANQERERRRKDEEAAWKRIMAARKRAHEDFLKMTRRESEVVAMGLRDRLEEVKAFARDAGAVIARADIAGVVAREVAQAAEAQIEEAFDKATEGVDESLNKLDRTVRQGLEDGLGFADLAPDVKRGIDETAREFERLSQKAFIEATASKEDLLKVVEDLRAGFLESGTATQEQLDAIYADPFDRESWAASAAGAGVSVDQMQTEMQDFANAVIYMREQMRQVDIQTARLGLTIEQDASDAVRSLVAGLSELNEQELRRLNGLLEGNDALNESARRLVRARIEALQNAAAFKAFAKEATALNKALRLPDNAGPLARLRRALGSAAKDVEKLRGTFKGLPPEIRESEEAAAVLVGTFDQIGSSLEGQGMVALFKLRREAKRFQEDLEAMGLEEPADAAGELTRDIGRHIASEIAKGVMAAVGKVAAVLRSVTQWVAGQLRSLITLAADSERVAEFVKNLSTTLPATIKAIAENLSAVIDGIVDAIPGIVEAITEAVPGIVKTLSEALPQLARELIASLPDVSRTLIKGISDLVVSLLGSLKDLLPELTDAIVQTFPMLADAISGVLSALGDIIPTIVRSAVDLVAEGVPQILKGVLKGLPDLIGGIFDGVVALINGAVQLLAETLPKIIRQVFNALPGLITGILAGVGDIVRAILVNLLPAIPDIIVEVVRLIIQAIPEIIIALVTGVVKLVPEIVSALVTGLIKAIPELLAALLIELPAVVIALGLELLAMVPRLAVDLLRALVKGIGDFFEAPFRTLGRLLAAPFIAFAEPFQEAWRTILRSWREVTDAFADLWRSMERLWSAAGDAWDSVKDFFEGIKDFFVELLNKINPLKTAEGEQSGFGKFVDYINPFGDRDDAEGETGSWAKDIKDAVVNGVKWIADAATGGGSSKARSAGGGSGSTRSRMGVRDTEELARVAERTLPRAGGGSRGGSRFPGGHPVAANTPEETERLIKRALRAGQARPEVHFNGGAVFSTSAAAVVDEITSRSYKIGTGKTGKLLNRRFGTMPGQRRS